MKHLEIGNISIPAFENIKLKAELIDLYKFRVTVIVILGGYALIMYLKNKQNENQIKEIIKSRSIDK